MADKIVPIRYIGLNDVWEDNLYGSGLKWAKGELQLVPGYLYDSFMRHPDMFEDARIGKMRKNEIDRTPPPRVTLEDEEPPLVDLNAMTKENLTRYAKSNFNLDVSQRTRKEEVVDLIRRQMGTNMPVGNYA